MPEITIPNAWNPRPYQMDAWKRMERGLRYLVIRAHRRWGKDDFALNWGAKSGTESPGTYWHCLPEYEQARKAIWDAVDAHHHKRRIDQAFPKEIRQRTREDMMQITLFNGSTWQAVGSDRADSLVGAGPSGIVMSEAALADSKAWDLFAPMILESGGWVIFISTVRGRNWFWNLGEYAKTAKGWHLIDQTVDDTDVFTGEQLEAERERYRQTLGDEAGEALFRQEYYNDPDVGASLAFIPGRLIARCRGYVAQVHRDEPVVWGLDVATTGADRSVLAVRKGRRWELPQDWREPDTMRLCDFVADRYRRDENKPDAIFVDATGVGAGVCDQLKRLMGGIVQPVTAAGQAANHQQYANVRAECWGNMRDAIKDQIQLPNHPDTLDQLAWPQIRLENVSERILVEKKNDIRERHRGSPDFADAYSLTYARPVMRQRPQVQDGVGRWMSGQNIQPTRAWADYDPYA